MVATIYIAHHQNPPNRTFESPLNNAISRNQMVTTFSKHQTTHWKPVRNPPSRLHIETSLTGSSSVLQASETNFGRMLQIMQVLEIRWYLRSRNINQQQSSKPVRNAIDAHQNLSNWRFESPSGFRTTFPKYATTYASSKEQMETTLPKNQRLCSEYDSEYAKNPALKCTRHSEDEILQNQCQTSKPPLVLANSEVPDNAVHFPDEKLTHRFVSHWCEEWQNKVT